MNNSKEKSLAFDMYGRCRLEGIIYDRNEELINLIEKHLSHINWPNFIRKKE